MAAILLDNAAMVRFALPKDDWIKGLNSSMHVSMGLLCVFLVSLVFFGESCVV
jgi:hypothetical protein